MILVSLDAIVQADATLIVGIVFIVTLKQAFKQKVTPDDLLFVAVAILLYVVSGIVAVLPDMASGFDLAFGGTPIAAHVVFLTGMSIFGSIALFYCGMGFTAGAVIWMMRRTAIS